MKKTKYFIIKITMIVIAGTLFIKHDMQGYTKEACINLCSTPNRCISPNQDNPGIKSREWVCMPPGT